MYAKVHTHIHECVLCRQAHIRPRCPPKPGVPGLHLSYDPQKSHLWLLHPALELCGLKIKRKNSVAFSRWCVLMTGGGGGLNATASHQRVERIGLFSVCKVEFHEVPKTCLSNVPRSPAVLSFNTLFSFIQKPGLLLGTLFSPSFPIGLQPLQFYPRNISEVARDDYHTLPP